MLNAQEVKAKLTERHILTILEKLGAIIYVNCDEYILSNTICHHGNKPKLYYYKETQKFKCYTDCGDSFDVIELIRRNKNYKKAQESIDWICVQFGFDTIAYGFGNSDKTINDWDFINTLPSRKKQANIQISKQIYDKKILNIFQDIYCSQWIDNGISIESMKKYEIKYCTLQQKIIIPHYDIDYNLIGIRGRAMLDEDIENGKYTPFAIGQTMYAHPLSQNLYGLYINEHAIRKKKKIMLVEAEKSVLQCDTMFGEENFTVALCGSYMSISQRDLILSLGVDEVVIALDKQFKHHEDEEADKWAKHIRGKIINLLAPYVRVSVLWDSEELLAYKDSPTDKSKDTLLKLMEKKIYVGTL